MRVARRAMVRIAGLVLFQTALVVCGAKAESYPSRAITMIVPYPAGGPSDALARVITEWGTVRTLTTKVVEGLFASDFGYLQDFYRIINFGDPSILEKVEPGSPFPKESLAVG